MRFNVRTLDVIATVGLPLCNLGVLGTDRTVNVICTKEVRGHGCL